MKEYIAPTIEKTKLDICDIITASGTNTPDTQNEFVQEHSFSELFGV